VAAVAIAEEAAVVEVVGAMAEEVMVATARSA
jgi:hypothetical protein